jgi:hypothetical protein
MQPTEHDVLPAADIQQLVPQGSGEVLLTPETRVLCIHRGRNHTQDGQLVVTNPRRGEPRVERARRKGIAYEGDYTDTFDSRHYIIAPGYFEVELAAAVHFKDRAVVPGSRNPETNFQASFIAIIGVVAPTGDGYKVIKAIDPKEDWDPFSDDDCAIYEIAFEALDRAGMDDPIDRSVVVASASSVMAGRPGKPASRVKGGSGARGTRGKTSIEVTDDSILQPIPADENRTVRDIQADRVAAARGKDED